TPIRICTAITSVNRDPDSPGIRRSPRPGAGNEQDPSHHTRTPPRRPAISLDETVGGAVSEPSHGPRRRIPLIEAALAVAACAIALMLAASTGGTDPMAPATFASAGIDCAPSPSATAQVFLKVNATEYEIIAARLAIASVPGVTIDDYLD